jgi:hypothetical protein
MPDAQPYLLETGAEVCPACPELSEIVKASSQTSAAGPLPDEPANLLVEPAQTPYEPAAV